VPRRSRRETNFEHAGRLAAAITSHPREFVAILTAAIATFAIIANALFLQKGPHPAPIFAAKPLLQQSEKPLLQQSEKAVPSRLPAQAAIETPQPRIQLIANIQKELTRKGFYDGPADGIWGARTDGAVRDFAQAANVKINPEASDTLLRAIATSNAKPVPPAAVPAVAPAADPIAKLVGAPAPSKRVTAVQRALSDFGYGQIKVTGVFDPETRAALEKFERDRRLPPTGQMSDRVVRELAAMTGRPLE
jgi:peptidoglycan hydrolase-like protein with peptidoglycan-binding domain